MSRRRRPLPRRHRIGGERYFVWTEYLPDLHPSGWEAAELFAISYSDASVEPCAPIQLTDFYNESTTSVVVPVIPRWSPDGSMVAFLAFDSAKRDACPPEAPSSECPEPYDIWVADFDTASGPALSNRRVLAPEFGASHPLSWSRDGAYLATSKARAGGRTGIFVIDTSNGAVFDVSPDPEVFSVYPAFSPVADRIAFIGPTPRGDAFRHEIYVGDFAIDPQTQTPAPLGSVVQVTDKKNMKSLEVRFPAWSPDGGHLAFSGEDGGWLNSIRRLYRIASDGSAKAVLLSAFDESVQFSMSSWRTSP